MTFRPILLLSALIVMLAAVPAQAAKLPGGLIYGDYDLRMSVSMESNFSFNPVTTTSCGDPKPEGFAGSGREILHMSSPKPLRVTFMSQPKTAAIVRKDTKSGFPMVGETRRTGDFTHYVCGEAQPTQAIACNGSFPLHINADVQFLYSATKVIMDGDVNPSTRDLIPACDDHVGFDWDGAVARTGDVLLKPATAPSPRSKLKANSFTLVAVAHEQCTLADFGTGSCGTTWTWKANLRKVRAKKGHH